LLFVALLLEVGLLLVLIPWSRFWERNYFADVIPVLQMALANNYVRGAVSGLGLVNIWLAIVELYAVVMQRRDPVAVKQDG
jgi:hypothetical protein